MDDAQSAPRLRRTRGTARRPSPGRSRLRPRRRARDMSLFSASPSSWSLLLLWSLTMATLVFFTEASTDGVGSRPAHARHVVRRDLKSGDGGIDMHTRDQRIDDDDDTSAPRRAPRKALTETIARRRGVERGGGNGEEVGDHPATAHGGGGPRALSEGASHSHAANKEVSWLRSIILPPSDERGGDGGRGTGMDNAAGEDDGGYRGESSVTLGQPQSPSSAKEGKRHPLLSFRGGRKILQQTCCQCPIAPSPPPNPIPPPSPPPPPIVTSTLREARPAFRLSRDAPG